MVIAVDDGHTRVRATAGHVYMYVCMYVWENL